MKTPRSLRHYLHDILQAVEDIEVFTEGLTEDEFCQDRKTQLAIIRCFEVMGEASRVLPNEFKNTHPNVPWREMNTMRNMVLHEYFGVNLRVVWKTIQEDLPYLRNQIEAILEDETL